MLPRAASAPGRRPVLALAALVVLAAGALSGCGGGVGDTTCGEVESMSTAERVDLLERIADELAADLPQDLDEASQEDKEDRAGLLVRACAAEDDDTRLADLGGV